MNDQNERLKTLLMWSFFAILTLSCILIAYIIVDISGVKKAQINLENLIQNVQLKHGANGVDGENGVSIVGPQGIQGPKGEKGDLGSAGQDSISQNTIVIKEVPIKGDVGEQGLQGEAGPQGEPGVPGRTVFTRLNPFTGEGECRYAGDSGWLPEEECK